MRNILVLALAFFISDFSDIRAKTWAETEETQGEKGTEIFLIIYSDDLTSRFGPARFSAGCGRAYKAVTAKIGLQYIDKKEVNITYKLSGEDKVVNDWFFMNDLAFSDSRFDFKLIQDFLNQESFYIEFEGDNATFELSGIKRKIEWFLDECSKIE